MSHKTIGAIALTFVMLVSMSDFAYARRKRPLDRGRPPKTDHIQVSSECDKLPQRCCDRRGLRVLVG